MTRFTLNHKGRRERLLPAHITKRSMSRKKAPYPIPVYAIQLVAERVMDGPVVKSPSAVAELLVEYLARADREHFVVVLLATNHRVLGIHTCHIGTLSASLVRIADVFKPAILANAASIIVGHNHPSGNVEPSREDIALTRRLVEAGQLFDMPVRDSIIVSTSGDYTSLAERGFC